MRCARIRQFHPSVRIEPTSEDALGKVPRRRGRPKGSRTAPRLVPVRHRQFLGVDCTAYPEVHPALWNLLVSLTTTLFKGMLGVLRQLKVEQRGDEQCRLLFEELPEVMVATVREIASWWWTHDRGFQGTTVRCPQCHNHDLKYIGERKKEIVSPYGDLSVYRSYYRCESASCTGPQGAHTTVYPLDVRLGLDGQSFLPSCQEVVAWLTGLDPYGKSLAVLNKLASFLPSRQTAWRITQRVGEIAKARDEEALQQAFQNPRSPVLPRAEMASPEIGALMIDGTCGRVDADTEEEDTETGTDHGLKTEPARGVETESGGGSEARLDGRSETDLEEDPDAPRKPGQRRFEENRPEKTPSTPPQFREIKVAQVGHVCSSQPGPGRQAQSRTDSTADKKKKRKVRPQGQEPRFLNKKMAVHLGSPLTLFQMIFILIHRLGLHQAKTILVLGDGAHWIWRGVQEHIVPLGIKVVEILDFYHWDEHVWKLAHLLHGKRSQGAIAWAREREAEVLGGRLDSFFAALEKARLLANARLEQNVEKLAEPFKFSNDDAKDILKEVNYFHNNRGRIDYATYLANGYLIGSGAIEGCCRHLIKERIDRSGMRWSPEGAMNVLRNRTLIKNGDWDRFWQTEAERRWQRYQDLIDSIRAA